MIENYELNKLEQATKIIELFLDDKPDTIQDHIFIVDDIEKCAFEFHFYRDSIKREPYIVTDSTLTVVYESPSGVNGDDKVEVIESNKGRCTLNNWVVDTTGTYKAIVQAYDTLGKKSFGEFKFKIEKAINLNVELNETPQQLLNKLISEVTGIVNSESIRILNENERIKNELERIKKDGWREADYESLKRIIIDENQAANLQNQINNVNSQLDDIMNESIPSLDKKRYKITRETKKIFDDATVVNINNTGKQAEICGFRSNSDLANYADRDSAVMYVDGTLPTCLILEVINFTVDSVQVMGDTSSIEVGMIIDCMNQSELNPFNQATKFSGFVSEVNKQTIKVNGWYQLGNTSTGQIPNKNRIIINPVTKLWTMNNNIFLNADSFGWGGVIAEYGMFNRKSVATGNENYRLSGIDLINYDGVCEVGYSMRNANALATTKTKIGFKSDKALQNFRSTNASEVGYNSIGDLVGYNAQGGNVGFKANMADTMVAFKTENDRFNVSGFGKIKNLLLGNKVYGDDANIIPYDAWIHFVGNGTHKLPQASTATYANIKIIAKGDCVISGNMFTNTGDISTYSLGAWRTLELFSDGNKWFRIF